MDLSKIDRTEPRIVRPKQNFLSFILLVLKARMALNIMNRYCVPQSQLLLVFMEKNLERIGFKVLLSLQANKLGSVAK